MLKTQVDTTLVRVTKTHDRIELGLRVETNQDRGRSGTVVVTRGQRPGTLAIAVSDGVPDLEGHLVESGYESVRRVEGSVPALMSELWEAVGDDGLRTGYVVQARTSPWASAASKALHALVTPLVAPPQPPQPVHGPGAVEKKAGRRRKQAEAW